MPGLNGADLLQRLRADPDQEVAEIHAIMLTGHGGEDSEVRCLEAGANDFVTKPINLAVLRARIETQLRLRSMRRQLQKQNEELEEWRQNLEQDLAAARLTQRSLIPQKPPNIPGWDVAACFRPVIEVGGDIYGWLRPSPDRMIFWIADATGHGAAAALLTTLTKLLFQHGMAESDSPAAIMRAVNNDFRSTFGAHSFMTAMCVRLDLQTACATIVGAGHPPLLVTRRTGPTGTDSVVRASVRPQRPAPIRRNQYSTSSGRCVSSLYRWTLRRRRKRSQSPDARITRPVVDGLAPTAEAILGSILRRILPGGDRTRLADDLAAIAVQKRD